MARILEFAWCSTATNAHLICAEKKTEPASQEGKKLFKLQRHLKHRRRLGSLLPKPAEIFS